MDDFASSSKVDAVVDAILKMMQLTRREEVATNGQATQHKAIVFSQYTNMLDILEWKLKTVNVPVVKLVGSMTLQARQAAMAAFKGHVEPEVPVILMSLKAGGEGLNLQEASHVFVLEPWWNPAVEQQVSFHSFLIASFVSFVFTSRSRLQ
jgi:DNA repair protein RAD16